MEFINKAARQDFLLKQEIEGGTGSEYVPLSQKGAPSGVAALDASQQIVNTQLITANKAASIMSRNAIGVGALRVATGVAGWKGNGTVSSYAVFRSPVPITANVIGYASFNGVSYVVGKSLLDCRVTFATTVAGVPVAGICRMRHTGIAQYPVAVAKDATGSLCIIFNLTEGVSNPEIDLDKVSVGHTGATEGMTSGWTVSAVADLSEFTNLLNLTDDSQTAFFVSPTFTGTPTAPNLRFTNTLSSQANTLDYYEEGVFTPSIVAATPGTPTFAQRQGRYTRIGNRVFYSVYVAMSSKGGMAGALQMDGLPFVVNAQTGARGAVSMSFVGNMALTENVPITAFHLNNNTRVNFYKQVATGVPSSMSATDINDTFTAYFSGQYEVA